MKRAASDLVSVIPELRVRNTSYDIYDYDEGNPPDVGDYMVTITGKPGFYKPGTVYQVAAARMVMPKKPRVFDRWALTLIVTPDMLPLTVMNVHHGYAWVNGENAHPIFWHPRSKKK